MKKISILGSTGSIGRQTLSICEMFPGELQVTALVAHADWQGLARQVRKHRPQLAALADEQYYPSLKEALANWPVEIIAGPEAAICGAQQAQADIVVNAIPGVAGLKPTLAALSAGKDVALANKESLAAAGKLTTELAREKKACLIPLDSEHSAIAQCLAGEISPPAKLILTASGGPFRHKTAAELAQVSPEEALAHPTWSMGHKVTIDSASMANKGLEVIEARWLFEMDYDNIEVLVHPQSIIHSMVSFEDGAIMAQLGPRDMRLPIQYALLGPSRLANAIPPLDWGQLSSLTFEEPDCQRFPALALAYAAGRAGDSHTTAFNAANEVLGAAFLAGRIPFTAIGKGLEWALAAHQGQDIRTIEDVQAVDGQTRLDTEKYIATIAKHC